MSNANPPAAKRGFLAPEGPPRLPRMCGGVYGGGGGCGAVCGAAGVYAQQVGAFVLFIYSNLFLFIVISDICRVAVIFVNCSVWF